MSFVLKHDLEEKFILFRSICLQYLKAVVGPAPIFLELRSTPTPLQKMELDPVQAPILTTGASSDPVPLQLQIKQSSLLFRS